MFIRDLLQPTHLIIILAIVLLIIGPGKLVGLGGALGSSIRDFRKSMKDEDSEEGGTNKTASGNLKSVADDGFDDAPATRTAIPATVGATSATTMSAKSIADDEIVGEVVTVGAGRAETAETVTRAETVPLASEPIRVGTTRRGYRR